MPSSSGTQGLIINVSLILFLSIKDPVEQKKSLLIKANVIFNKSSLKWGAVILPFQL